MIGTRYIDEYTRNVWERVQGAWKYCGISKDDSDVLSVNEFALTPHKLDITINHIGDADKMVET